MVNVYTLKKRLKKVGQTIKRIKNKKHSRLHPRHKLYEMRERIKEKITKLRETHKKK